MIDDNLFAEHLVETKHLASIKMLTDLTYLLDLLDLTPAEKVYYVSLNSQNARSTESRSN